jgi:hypothetical protein
MNNQQTADLLTGLKLKRMAEAFTAMTNLPVQERPGMEPAGSQDYRSRTYLQKRAQNTNLSKNRQAPL